VTNTNIPSNNFDQNLKIYLYIDVPVPTNLKIKPTQLAKSILWSNYIWFQNHLCGYMLESMYLLVVNIL